MTGYIHIEAIDEGLKGEVKLEHISRTDKMHVLHTVAKALDMNERDLELFVLLESTGILTSMHHQEVLPMDDEEQGPAKAKNPESKEARFDKALEALKQVFMEGSYE